MQPSWNFRREQLLVSFYLPSLVLSASLVLLIVILPRQNLVALWDSSFFRTSRLRFCDQIFVPSSRGSASICTRQGEPSLGREKQSHRTITSEQSHRTITSDGDVALAVFFWTVEWNIKKTLKFSVLIQFVLKFICSGHTSSVVLHKQDISTANTTIPLLPESRQHWKVALNINL